MKIKFFILMLIVIVGILPFYLSGCGKSTPKYHTEEAIKGRITETITASGTINPVTTTNVGTQVSGTILELFVDFNSPVKKGQVLAQIDPALFEARVGQQRANLVSAEANLAKLKATLENDKRTLDRYKRLYEKDFIARSEVDLADTVYNNNLAQIQGAKAQILQAQAALNSALTDLGYTKIVSPVDGIVVSRSVDIGQTVAATFQTPTLFLVAQDLTKMQINTSVAEADISRVKEGQEVEFTVDGYPDETFKGKVMQVRNAPTTMQNVVTYDVVVGLDNKDMKLKPGMTANVTIITASKDNVLLVPNEAFRFVMDEGKTLHRYKEKGIWVLNKSEKPVRVTVKTGISDESNTEITAGNVQAGSRIIIDMNNEDKKGAQKRQMPMRMF